MYEENQAQENPSSKNDSLYHRFSTERDDWTNQVKSLAERLKNIYDVGDLLTDLYSQRQIAGDYVHEIASLGSRLNKIYRERKRERYIHYTQNYDLRLDKDPKNMFIEVDLAELVERRELIQNHLEFMRETLRSIDTICYGVKHRIALEEYRRG